MISSFFPTQQSLIQEVIIVPRTSIYYDRYTRQTQIRDIRKVNMQIKVSLKFTMPILQSREGR